MTEIMKENYDTYTNKFYYSELIPIAPPSAEKFDGKIPAKYDFFKQQWVGFKQWSIFKAGEDDIESWSKYPPHNIGLKTTYYPTIDIDIDDDVNAIDTIIDLAVKILGNPTFRTRTNTNRLAIIYQLAKDELPGTKSIIKIPEVGKIELLGKGQQVVVFGQHQAGGQVSVAGKNPTSVTRTQITQFMEAINKEFKIDEPKQENEKDDKFDYKGAMQEIVQGENWHDNVVSLAMRYANKRLSKDETVSMLQGLMHQCYEDSSRWKTRYDDIERCVNDAFKKKGQEDEDELPNFDNGRIEQLIDLKHMPTAPGNLQDIADSVYACSPHPNKTVSMVTALGLLAGIAGRRFNISNTGLNLYLTLLMETGMGKDIINKYIKQVLINENPLSNAHHFIGPQRFTGPKALMTKLNDRKNFISVFTEAGMLFKSGAGDSSGLQRTILDLYTKSGKHDVTMGEEYSDSANSIGIVHSPSFSLIHESTSKVFIDEIKKRDSMATGELPRMFLFRVEEEKSPYNDSANFYLKDSTRKAISHLIEFCLETNTENDPRPVDISYQSVELKEEIVKINHEFTHAYNRLINTDTFRAVMYSRAWVKMVKVASLSAVINYNIDDDPFYENVEIRNEDWEFAKLIHQFEMQVLSIFMKGSSEDPVEEVVKNTLAPAIKKIVKNEYKNEHFRVTEQMSQLAMFHLSALRRATYGNTIIQNWGARAGRAGNSAKDGLVILINGMVDGGYLKSIPKEELLALGIKKKQVYQCTKDFEFLLADPAEA